ncbi:MAG: GDP-mannose 4,6-dehydratase [Treponema sp.]|uniref:GDP-mannose 4,6-dehydratase n=1 Tax=Treponema sp. TaxID=166 RepID=UPI003FA2BD85
MKALIAGGAGFIGSHLADYLLNEGNEVVCIDNFFIGTRQNILHLLTNPHYVFYQYDLNNMELLHQVFNKEKPDYVFHLAANSDIQASAQNPIIEYQNTYSTTFNLLEAMRLHNVKKMFFASTSAVYGNKDALLNEETALLAPISYYGGAKLGSEGLLSAYAYMNDMDVLIFRFPNVIGPRLTHGVIFDFIKRLKKDSSKLLILGDGTQTKPYLYVFDLIEAIMKFKNIGKGVTLYNVGVDTATSVTRIAEIVCQKIGASNVSFEYTGGKGGWKGDVPKFQYDLSKIHTAGWTAKYTSDEAVALTVENNLV